MKALVFLGMAICLASCSDDTPKVTPKYTLGRMVKMKAFGTEGMVVSAACYKVSGCFYDVRFSSMQLSTNTSLFGRDGPIDFSPVALVTSIREFELEGIVR